MFPTLSPDFDWISDWTENHIETPFHDVLINHIFLTRVGTYDFFDMFLPVNLLLWEEWHKEIKVVMEMFTVISSWCESSSWDSIHNRTSLHGTKDSPLQKSSLCEQAKKPFFVPIKNKRNTLGLRTKRMAIFFCCLDEQLRKTNVYFLPRFFSQVSSDSDYNFVGYCKGFCKEKFWLHLRQPYQEGHYVVCK